MSANIMTMQGVSMGARGQGAYMLDRNDRVFSKRIYTVDDNHTSESKPYMQSSIDLSFDGGNYFGIRKEIKEKDLKAILATSDNKGKF